MVVEFVVPQRIRTGSIVVVVGYLTTASGELGNTTPVTGKLAPVAVVGDEDVGLRANCGSLDAHGPAVVVIPTTVGGAASECGAPFVYVIAVRVPTGDVQPRVVVPAGRDKYLVIYIVKSYSLSVVEGLGARVLLVPCVGVCVSARVVAQLVHARVRAAVGDEVNIPLVVSGDGTWPVAAGRGVLGIESLSGGIYDDYFTAVAGTAKVIGDV